MMDGWFDNGVGWGGWLTMTLMMGLFWGLVIMAVIAVLRAGAGRSAGSAATDPGAARDPLGILDERFARGEIDAEEYHLRREALGRPGPPLR